MDTYALRRATHDDIDVLVRHRRKMWCDIAEYTPEELDASDVHYREWVAPRLRSAELAGIVALRGDEAAASGIVWKQPIQPRPRWTEGSHAYVMSMYTEPAHRGRGLAPRIVHEAMAWAKENGCSVMALHASQLGRPVYEKMGFERTWEMRLRL
ncbi:MAG TPA: GNAT family N-acetyltransferase [Candidatus Thermoplasmatota archaeon]|nr:GNAT family N-acetyltransferase [Candidatus Thermoplasmatota archaeon]